MKTLLLCFISLLFFYFSSVSQTINSSVIATSGGYYEAAGLKTSITIGEPLIETYFSNDLVLTQGFQQTINCFYEQVIYLPAGWSGLSSYLIPNNTLVEYIFYPVNNNLTLCMLQANIYWPGQGINTLVNWDTYSGYKLHMTAADSLKIMGCKPENNTIYLNNGWSLLPVLSSNNVNCIDLFAPLGDTLTIVLEMAGNLMYWPGQGITSLEYLLPGKAYKIHVSHDCSLTFQDNDAGEETIINEQQYEIITPWNQVVKSPNAHAIAIDKKVLEKMVEGDIIGIFTQEGWCSGVLEVTQQVGNDAIVAFGDDPVSNEFTDGFTEDESFLWKLFRPVTNELFNLEVAYNTSFPNTNHFSSNGLSKIMDVEMTMTSIADLTQATQIVVYPNPAQDILTIEYLNAKPDASRVQIYSGEGKLMLEHKLIENKTILNISNLKPGVYLIKIIDSSIIEVKKLIIY
ncbi:MAG: T9SS type A sorting domain-containing protein [Bacteroidales bacterium]|nr:T9SS type A sorting domain-containing protein [Bacteroidales bacterium]